MTPEARKKRTIPLTLHTIDPNGIRRADRVKAVAIELTTPSGQTVVIEPSKQGDSLLVYNPHGPLDHSIRPDGEPRGEATDQQCQPCN